VSDDVVGFEEYVAFRDGWATQGASTLNGAVTLAGPGGYKVRVKGKLASSLHLSDADLCARARTENVAKIKPFRKEDEPVKTRIVYGYDFFSFLRQSYCDGLVQTWEGVEPWMPVGYDMRKKAEMRIMLGSYLRSGKRAVSIDQSAFDTRQKKSWVRRCIECIFCNVEEQLRGRGDIERADEVRELALVELESFDNAEIEGVCKWEVGVPSGMRWTAVIDSILNRASAETVAEELNFDIAFARYQGDDAILVGEGPSNAWAQTYARLGLNVNQAKTWVCGDRCDFLHEVYDGVSARGFPARIGKSVIWKKPNLGRDFENANARLFEKVSDCLKGVRRGLGGCRLVATNLILRWVKRRGGSARYVREALDTPAYMGGFGFAGWGRRAVKVSGGEVIERRYVIRSGVHSQYNAFKDIILSRISGGTALKTDKCVMVFEAVKGLKDTPEVEVAGVGVKIKTSWTWRDGVPWSVSLKWEQMLRGRVLPERQCVPDGWLRGNTSATMAVKCCSAYKRYVARLKLNLENSETTGESWASFTDKMNRYWCGIVGYWCRTMQFAKMDIKSKGCLKRVMVTVLRYVGQWGLEVKV
jgi:hypothetical protein